MPTEILTQIQTARALIVNYLGQHQGDPQHATRYAMLQTALPSDLEPQMLEFAKQTAKVKRID